MGLPDVREVITDEDGRRECQSWMGCFVHDQRRGMLPGPVATLQQRMGPENPGWRACEYVARELLHWSTDIQWHPQFILPCRIWTGKVYTHKGVYGMLRALGETRSHRVAYRAFVGEIPKGMTVDHLCRQTLCCEPTHLQLLTNEDNARTCAHIIRNMQATHCPQGHPYSPENTRTHTTKKGNVYRYCRECCVQAKKKSADKSQFYKWLKRWREESVGYDTSSSMSARFELVSYQRILAMGWRAVPWIFHELDNGSPDWWFHALRTITGEDPVQDEDQGRWWKMVVSWQAWWEKRLQRIAKTVFDAAFSASVQPAHRFEMEGNSSSP